jgi:predicted phage terminase large subunit-like protein
VSIEITPEVRDRLKQVLNLKQRQVDSMTPDELAFVTWQLLWRAKRKKHQIPPKGDWTVWLTLAGRGAGKTRTAAETLGAWAAEHANTRWLVSAPTHGDVRDVCFEGESGLLNVIPKPLLLPGSDAYSKTLMEIRFLNGSVIKGIGAEEPNRFRGPQFHGGWLDELAAWQYAEEGWDLLMMSMRLGDHPRIIATTTPKPKKLIRRLVADKHTVVTRASTYDNIENLAPTIRRELLKHEGTAYGRQEIYGELIDPDEQGIIKKSWLQIWPPDKPIPALEFIVMSLDTAFTEETRDKKSGDTDYTGCTVWGVFYNEKQYNILLLDCWQERLGFPDLIARTKKEMKVTYGPQDQRAIIRPKIGPAYVSTGGRPPDILLIEDKGSGISLRQTLLREGIIAHPYNPGRTKKLDRLHAVSHMLAHGLVWVLGSETAQKKGEPERPAEWANDLVEQLITFHGEGTIDHDDLVDSSTQALRYIGDKNYISITEPYDDDPLPPQPVENPYMA